MEIAIRNPSDPKIKRSINLLNSYNRNEPIYNQAINDSFAHIRSEVSDNGYVKASSEYLWYEPHWFRDSSFISMAISDFAKYAKASSKEIVQSRELAHKINIFNLKAIERRLDSIKAALEKRYEDPDFYKLKNHMAARVDKDLNLFKKSYGNGAGVDDTIEDFNTWLRQYDTIPLILMALDEEGSTFGWDAEEKEFIRKYSRIITYYLGKIYPTPSSNAWEIETDYIHAYDIAAIYKAKEILKGFSEKGLFNMPKDEIEKSFNIMYQNGGIIGALRDHVSNGILYRRRKPYQPPDISAGVDSEEIFIFRRFGITDAELGDNVVKNTLDKIRGDLFNGNVLPIRNLQDDYFLGGRWLITGLEYAMICCDRGDYLSSERIINYVIRKHMREMPEQELVNVAHPESENGKRDLMRNNGVPIKKLNWSYAALMSAIVKFESDFARNAFDQNRMLLR